MLQKGALKAVFCAPPAFRWDDVCRDCTYQNISKSYYKGHTRRHGYTPVGSHSCFKDLIRPHSTLLHSRPALSTTAHPYIVIFLHVSAWHEYNILSYTRSLAFAHFLLPLLPTLMFTLCNRHLALQLGNRLGLRLIFRHCQYLCCHAFRVLGLDGVDLDKQWRALQCQKSTYSGSWNCKEGSRTLAKTRYWYTIKR